MMPTPKELAVEMRQKQPPPLSSFFGSEKFLGSGAVSKLDEAFDTTPEAKLAKKLGMSRKDLQSLFDEFDPDGSGELDAKEFVEFTLQLGIYFTPKQLHDTIKLIDADGNGTICIEEFMAWFLVQGPQATSKSTQLRSMLQLKVLGRKCAKDIMKATDSANFKNKTWTSKFALKMGECDDTCSIKTFFAPQGSDKFAEMNPPEGVKSAAFLDLDIRDGASDDAVAKLVKTIQQLQDMVCMPALNKLNRQWQKAAKAAAKGELPSFPGFFDGEPFHSYQVVNVMKTAGDAQVVRLAYWFRVDIEAIGRDVGFSLAPFLPSVAFSACGAAKLSDLFDSEGTTTLADWLGKASYELQTTWNTRALKAASVLQVQMSKFHKIFGLSKKWALFGTNAQEVGFGLGFLSRMVSKKRMEVSFEFEDFFEAAEMVALDLGLPMLRELEAKMRKAEGLCGMPPCSLPCYMKGSKSGLCVTIGELKDEEVKALIDAVGKIDGKTLGRLRDDFLTHYMIPSELWGGARRDYGWKPDQDEPVVFGNPLQFVKSFLDKCGKIALHLSDDHPEGRCYDDKSTWHACAAMFDFKAWAYAHLDTVDGINTLGVSTPCFLAGCAMKGMDVFKMLPSSGQIESAKTKTVTRGMMESELAMMKAFAPNIKEAPIYARFIAKQALDFVVGEPAMAVGCSDRARMLLMGGKEMYLASECAKLLDYDETELAAFGQEQPALRGIIAALWPILERATFAAAKVPELEGAKLYLAQYYEMFDHLKLSVALFLGVEYQSQLASWPFVDEVSAKLKEAFASPEDDGFCAEDFIKEQEDFVSGKLIKQPGDYSCEGVEVSEELGFEQDCYGSIKVEVSVDGITYYDQECPLLCDSFETEVSTSRFI